MKALSFPDGFLSYFATQVDTRFTTSDTLKADVNILLTIFLSNSFSSCSISLIFLGVFELLTLYC